MSRKFGYLFPSVSGRRKTSSHFHLPLTFSCIKRRTVLSLIREISLPATLFDRRSNRGVNRSDGRRHP
jgi:hypothetical protein